MNENDRWESKTVFEQKVVVLEGFRAHTNYTIKVITSYSFTVAESKFKLCDLSNLNTSINPLFAKKTHSSKTVVDTCERWQLQEN